MLAKGLRGWMVEGLGEGMPLSWWSLSLKSLLVGLLSLSNRRLL
jgi:hypothetical protein